MITKTNRRNTRGILATLLALVLSAATASAAEPDGRDAWWWDEAWWNGGQIQTPANHAVEMREVSYMSGDVEVPAVLFRPRGAGRYPAVLFQHGRRGLDALVQKRIARLAARGFVVLAPDVFAGRFIDAYPLGHDYAIEADVGAGLDYLLTLPDVSTSKACLASHTRGGYMTLKVAVTQGRQERDVACWLSFYPHMQDPNAPEPMQVYQYAPEADDLIIPALIFIGENEQYHRKRSIETAFAAMTAAGRTVQLVVYPGVGRGFDFRPVELRTFADDLAAKDASHRAAAFIRRHLAGWGK